MNKDLKTPLHFAYGFALGLARRGLAKPASQPASQPTSQPTKPAQKLIKPNENQTNKKMNVSELERLQNLWNNEEAKKLSLQTMGPGGDEILTIVCKLSLFLFFLFSSLVLHRF